MCGIAGIFAYGPAAPPVDQEELLRVREAMIRRGPDGAGLWISPDQRVGLAHRRLAIIDLSEAGAQPMATADGRYRITFNGEIYNYRELRKELEARGFVFRTGSDTEVLLNLYADRGENMVHALRGMYAFALWDEPRREIFLARDPFGIKPLYYADDGETLRLASQVKALLKGGGVGTAPEPAGSVGFLIWGHVPEPYTLYRDIRSLPAGSYMRVSGATGLSVTRYFDIGEEFRKAEHATQREVLNAGEILREAVKDSVRHHLVSDVPVGLFLSAGIDSSTLAGVAAEQGAALKTITLRFPEFKDTERDEGEIAAMFAEKLGFRHEAHWVAQGEFESELARILEAMDQPSTDGINTYFVSRAAAQSGMKVALSGLGGDEFFGGYPSFWQIPRITTWLSFTRAIPAAGRFARWVLAPIVSAFASPKYASLLEYGGTFGGAYLLRRAHLMPWEVRSALDPATVHAGLGELRILENLEATIRGLDQPRSRISTLELSWYMGNQLLRDADWAGMAHSLEIRVPLVDVRVLRSLAPLMVSDRCPTKHDFASVLRTRLPDAILLRSKSGFVTPVSEWISRSSGVEGQKSRGLRAWARRLLPPQPRMFRALMLVTDAYGGAGGIAKFNRDVVESIAAMPECAEIVVIPRLVFTPIGAVPRRVRFLSAAAGGKLRFVGSVLAEVVCGRFQLVIAGHINLAPLGALLAFSNAAASMLIIHGIDAWTRHRNAVVNWSLATFTFIVGVSKLTLSRFSSWTGVDSSRLKLLPNCVDLRQYGVGPKPGDLAELHGLANRTVMMTLGRLASGERYKGFDEIIEALPALAVSIPDIAYLICGDGQDRGRLEAKAGSLGVRDRVVFSGFVPEGKKADYYRLADAYVMPSQGEGFGIVLLEALACGIPVMGSRIDGSGEALLNGALGYLADPADPKDVERGILATLRRGRGDVPEALGYHYSRGVFAERAGAIVREALSCN